MAFLKPVFPWAAGVGLAAARLAVACLAASASGAIAGGFAVREQSATLMGSAFAGAAAGVDLSSSYWNPASFAVARRGLSSQSAVTATVSGTDLTNGVTSGPLGDIGGARATSIGETDYFASSAFAYRLSERAAAGVTVSMPFGWHSEADDPHWQGRLHNRASAMRTLNIAPSLVFEAAPGIHLAAGLQFQSMAFDLWQAGGRLLPPQPTVSIKLDDSVGVGFTAGVLVQAARATRIGIGYRSKIDHDLEGSFNTPAGRTAASANMTTPDMLTVSFAHAISPAVRVLGTAEWTNWSRVDTMPIAGVPGSSVPGSGGTSASLDTHWSDGWLLSAGVDYSATADLTVRAGVGWERSPVQSARARFSGLPESDRVWTALGASYRIANSTTLDVSYAHVFFKDAHLTRDTLSRNGIKLDADVQAMSDIVSIGVSTRF